MGMSIRNCKACAAGRMVNYWSNLPGGTSREIRQSEGVDSRDDRKKCGSERYSLGDNDETSFDKFHLLQFRST